MPKENSPTVWSRIAVWLRSWFEIPFGYEDENGFHYGHEPATPQFLEQWAAKRKILTDRACDAMNHPMSHPSTSVEAPADTIKSNRPVHSVC